MLIFSRMPVARVRALVRAQGMRPVRVGPDVVLTVGGDGTLLLAEHRYPGVPKLPVGRSKTSRTCGILDMDDGVRRLAAAWRAGRLETRAEMKLSASIVRGARERRLPDAMNDVVVRNRVQAHALRFSVSSGRRKWDGQIGDGVIVATPFGSTGYFESVTRTTFAAGIGLAFSNTVAPNAPAVLSARAVVEVRIEREDALVSIDTLERTWRMRRGDIVRRPASRACSRSSPRRPQPLLELAREEAHHFRACVAEIAREAQEDPRLRELLRIVREQALERDRLQCRADRDVLPRYLVDEREEVEQERVDGAFVHGCGAACALKRVSRVRAHSVRTGPERRGRGRKK